MSRQAFCWAAWGCTPPWWSGPGRALPFPLTGFGFTLAKGVQKAVSQHGLLGALTGGISATAGGITAAIFFGFLVALLFRAKPKR